jgi:hypothetical protein
VSDVGDAGRCALCGAAVSHPNLSARAEDVPDFVVCDAHRGGEPFEIGSDADAPGAPVFASMTEVIAADRLRSGKLTFHLSQIKAAADDWVRRSRADGDQAALAAASEQIARSLEALDGAPVELGGEYREAFLEFLGAFTHSTALVWDATVQEVLDRDGALECSCGVIWRARPDAVPTRLSLTREVLERIAEGILTDPAPRRAAIDAMRHLPTPAEEAARLTRMFHVVRRSADAIEERRELHDEKRRLDAAVKLADEVTGKPGRKSPVITAADVADAYWRLFDEEKKKPSQPRVAEVLHVEQRTVRNAVARDGVTWPPPRPARAGDRAPA